MNVHQGFKTTGFYLHTHWAYNYPFAVRSWARGDFAGMFELLRALDFDRVMIWPITEALPPPLSEEDARYLDDRRAILDDARAAGLESWLAFAPAITAWPAIRGEPVSRRHFNLHARTFHLDDPAERNAYYAHLGEILARLNNADAYVFIDGDPGGYPGARAEEYRDLLCQAGAILGQVGAEDARVVAWLWSGWGADWVNCAPWTDDFRPLTEAVLRQFQANPPDEAWELLPGRSFIEGWANGRVNLRLVEGAGLLRQSTLMAYEIVEFEPVPPAVTLQFDAIRRVLRQELRLAGEVRGIFANAQTPVMPLPNLYFFARAAKDPAYLDQPDEQALRDFADLLGGPADLLVPAWSCLDLPLKALPGNLAQRLRDAALSGVAAQGIPGGPERYLHILADHLETWQAVQAVSAEASESEAQTVERLSQAILALEGWQRLHGFSGAGEGGGGFAWEYCHPRLLQPLSVWVRANPALSTRLPARLAGLLEETGRFSREDAGALVGTLLRGEVNPAMPGRQLHNRFT